MYCCVTQLTLKLGRGRDLREVATHLNASSFPEERRKCIFFAKRLSCFNVAEYVCEKKHL